MTEGTDSSSNPRPGFTVSRGAWLLLIACAAIAGLLALPEAADPERTGFVVGKVVAKLVLPLLVGWVVFKCGARSASNLVIMLVAAAGVCAPLSRRVEQQKLDRELQDKLRALQEAQKADDPAARMKALDEAVGMFEKVGETRPNGNDDVAVLARMLRRFQQAGQDYQRLVDEFHTAGGVDAATLATSEAIDAQLELAGRALAGAEGLAATARTYVADFEAEMRREGVSQAEIDGFLQEARDQAPRLKQTQELRDSDVRYFAACRDILRSLRTHHGHWKYVPATQAVEFDDSVSDADMEAYNRAAQALLAEVEAQQRSGPGAHP